jgi:hypothetical protein
VVVVVVFTEKAVAELAELAELVVVAQDRALLLEVELPEQQIVVVAVVVLDRKELVEMVVLALSLFDTQTHSQT